MKKLLVLITLLGLTFSLFAQEAKATGLTDKDVDSFCKNYERIYVEMDKLGIDMQNPSSIMEAEAAGSSVSKTLNKYGITGKNSFDKLKAICYGYAVNFYDATFASDPQTALLLKKLGKDPMAEVRNKVAENDLNIVQKHMDSLTSVFTEAASNFEEDEINDYAGAAADNSEYAKMAAALLSSMKKPEEESTSKYNTNQRFTIKRYAREVWIVVQPEDITFENSSDAAEYASNYTGVAGKWEMCNSYGYLGDNNDKKPFYVWVSGGVAYYSKFPIDPDTGKPDKFIPDNKVTPEIASQTILQMYRVSQ